MRFAAAVLALLAAMAGLMFWAESLESVTYDEPMHIASGFAFLKTHDYSFNEEHPPLTKALAAVPLLFTGAELPPGPIPQNTGAAVEWSQDLVHKNKIPAATLVRAARSAMVLLTLVLGAFLAWWCRARYGAGAAMAALALFVFDPGFLSHGHYVTSDVAAALGMFGTCALWSEWLKRGGWRLLTGAAMMFGFALSVKFSCLALLGILPLQAVLETALWRNWRTWNGWRWTGGLAACLLGAAAVIMLVYAPDGLRILGPKHLWWRGVESVLEHNRTGHPTYLMGEYGQFGSWRYFPVAFAVKTTMGLLAIVAVSIVALRLRIPVVLWLPPTVIVAAAMSSSINLGLRHILTLYPFLFALVALAWSRAGRRMHWVLAALVLLHAGESMAAMPNPIGFFNLASGGPENGHKWVLDSNLDWGQDLAKVPHWLDSRGYPRTVCMEYFGTGNPALTGLKTDAIPRTWHTPERARVDCLGIISVTLLYDLYLEPGSFRWLREERKPMAVIGSSLWVYDLRRPAK